MTDEKVVEKKMRKLRRIRKKTLFTLLLQDNYDLRKSVQELYKKVYNTKGEIKSDLSLKELDNGMWNMIISVDGETHVNLNGHLYLVLDNIQLFKKVYDFEKPINKNSETEEKVYKENIHEINYQQGKNLIKKGLRDEPSTEPNCENCDDFIEDGDLISDDINPLTNVCLFYKTPKCPQYER